MAYYAPPTEDLTLFNPDVFLTTDAGDFLTFPVAQGSQVFPFGLTASSITTTDPTTIDTLVMSDLNPQYRFDYPVNSGRIDFYANTAGGTSTRGCKIDATGVHTNSKFDTIDETAGTLDIGTNAARTGAINIGTGADGTSARTITIGNSTGAVGSLNLKTRTIAIGGSNCVTASTDATNINITATSGVTIQAVNNVIGGTNVSLRGTNINQIGDNITAGTINLGRTDSTANSTAINIGVGTGSTSLISIGRGSPISIQNGATTTLTAAVPIQVSYSGTAPTTAGTTAIGFTNSSSNNTFTQSVAAVYDILSFNLTSGVWLVEGCFVFSGATGGGRKLSITTTSGSSANDRANGVPTGTFGSLQVATVFAFSTTTTVYLTIDITAALGGSGTNFTTARWTRIA